MLRARGKIRRTASKSLGARDQATAMPVLKWPDSPTLRAPHLTLFTP